MNKLLSLIVVLVLAVSLAPAGVFAESGSDDRNDEPDDSDDREKSESDDNDDSDEYRERYEYRDGDVRIKEEIRIRDGRVEQKREVRDERFDERVEIREEVRERMDGARERWEKARERYDSAHDRYEAARERYQETRDKVRDAREKVRECDGSDNETCVELRERVREHAPDFLRDSAHMVIEALHEHIERIENSDLSDEEKEELIAKLRERIAELEAVGASIDDSADDEEIRERTNDVREAWGHTKSELQRQAGFQANEKLKHVYEQLVKLGNRLDNAVDKLEGQGYDTSTVDEMIDEYEAKLAEAREKYGEAREAYDAALEEGDRSQAVAEANEYVREAHALLKEARAMLRDIVHEIKGIADVDLNAESDDDSDDDEDDSTETDMNATNNETVEVNT